MRIVKRIALVALAISASVSLSACGTMPTQTGEVLKESNDEVSAYYVTLPDGDKVDCIVYDSHSAGGVKCLWGEKSISTEATSELSSSIESAASRDVVCVEWDSFKAGGIDCNIRGNW